LVGPTGIGKTEISFQIAKNIFEIISSDSVQIYRYLDIGSGKPTKEERTCFKHHLIDIIDPNMCFSAGDYCREALVSSKKIFRVGKIPLFVGGTFFYIDSFFEGLSDIPVIDDSIKKQLDYELKVKGLNSLYEELLGVDKLFACKIHFNDAQRITRGLEVYRGTGKPISSYYKNRKGFWSEKTFYIGLYMEREELYKRIDQRVNRMISSGFIDEVTCLRDMGYGPELKSMKSIGYYEINCFLDNRMPLVDAIEHIKRETKRYAKRQRTWLRRNKLIQWFKTFEVDRINNLLYEWLDKN